MPRGPHQVTPPISCFTGLTVCLKTIRTSSIKAPRLLPVKLMVKHKDMGPADIGYTVVVTPVTLEQVCKGAGGDGVNRTARCPQPSYLCSNAPVSRQAIHLDAT